VRRRASPKRTAQRAARGDRAERAFRSALAPTPRGVRAHAACAPACAAAKRASAHAARTPSPNAADDAPSTRSVWAENLPVVGSGIRDVRYIFLTRLRETVRPSCS